MSLVLNLKHLKIALKITKRNLTIKCRLTYQHTCHRIWPHSGMDPGFPRRGTGANPYRDNNLLHSFSRYASLSDYLKDLKLHRTK